MVMSFDGDGGGGGDYNGLSRCGCGDRGVVMKMRKTL